MQPLGICLAAFASESIYKNTQNKLQYAKNRWNAATDLFGRHEPVGRYNFMRILSGFERLLLLGGLLLVAVYAAARFYSVVYPHATLRDFWLNQAATTHQHVIIRPIQPNPGIPDFRLWSPKRIEAYQTGASTNVPAPLGVLKISSVGIAVRVPAATLSLLEI
jgi:hypothetical protein